MGDRRQFLQGGLAAAGCAALAPLYAPLARASTSLRLTPLVGRLALVQGAAANIIVASTGKELILVDGGSSTDARALLQLLDAHYPGQPLRAVFNTHWHWIQTGFNATARAQGVDVIAHENTRLWLTTTVNSRWEHKVYKPQPQQALPNRTFFYGPQQYEFGGTKIDYVHLDPAHTDGDIYVHFPEENVIVVGDVLAPGRYPIIDEATNGWLGGINGALHSIGELANADTKLVPGSGPVSGLSALKEQQEMGVAVMTSMAQIYRKGGTFEEFVASRPTADYDAKFGDPSLFLKVAFDTAWYQVNTMGGLSTGLPMGPGGRPGFGRPPVGRPPAGRPEAGGPAATGKGQ
jgi:cyclase